jgi:uncharacterized damage-inducible protein DinB
MQANTDSEKSLVVRYAVFHDSFHYDLIKVMSELTSAELNWRPTETSNSIGNIINHILGAESFWIHRIIGGIEMERNRESEFRVEDFLLPNLLYQQEAVRKVSQEVLRNLSNCHLERARLYWSVRSQSQKRSTIHQCLIHISTHSARHLGQIYYLRRMYSEMCP